MESYGQRLEFALKARRRSRAWLSNELGISKQAIGQVISGSTIALKAHHHDRATQLLGVRALWLSTGDGLTDIHHPTMKDGQPLMVRSSERGSAFETATANDADGYIRLELLDVQASAGPGVQAVDVPEVLQRVSVLETWARSSLGGNLNKIKLISARGTSMQGTIENGDVLFVDASVRMFDGDGIYVIARGGDVQVKRLQKLNDEVLAIISDNRAYESERLTAADAEMLIICGRVLAGWTLKKFW